MVGLLDRIRWRTLSAALAPAFVGTGLALADGGPLSPLAFLSCGPCALLIQIGTNLVNDALDLKHGVDGPRRIGPRRLTTPAAARAFYFSGIFCFPLALLCSLPALYLRGMKLLLIEAVCCCAGYLYTGGPYPLGYHALGDATVFLFFGIVATSAARFVHQGISIFIIVTVTAMSTGGSLLQMDSLLGGSQVGLMAVNLLVVNNLRDIDADAKAGKRTISNLLGYRLGRWQLALNLVVTYLLSILWLWIDRAVVCALSLVTLPYGLCRLHDVFRTEPSVLYNGYLRQWSLLHLVHSLALLMGLLLVHLFD